jgi:hypothetical protein
MCASKGRETSGALRSIIRPIRVWEMLGSLHADLSYTSVVQRFETASCCGSREVARSAGAVRLRGRGPPDEIEPQRRPPMSEMRQFGL